MPKLTRREFAKLLALGLGAGAGGLPLPGQGALAAPGGKPQPGTLDPALPLHPLLQYGAIVEPDKRVRVIVQKVKPEHNGRKIAADGEAEHLEEFAFVKAHSMVVKQGRLPKLALHPHVFYISPDGPVQRHAAPATDNIVHQNLKTTYPRTISVQNTWNNQNFQSRGQGVAVAILDSGVNGHPDLGNVVKVVVNPDSATTADQHGHGTHVAGIIKGRAAGDTYVGLAPDCTLISVKIADDQGFASQADLLRGLQWAYDNRATYNIRAVNVSMTTGTAESYKTSPVCAAVEQLWFNGVLTVVAAGNRGSVAQATWYPPANDPYAITVGALDDNGTIDNNDNRLAAFSSRGKTQDGYYKPEIVAPGRRIVSTLASTGSTVAKQFPERIVDGKYIRLSGTSMAAPMVAGAIALLYARFPKVTPDQAKWLLVNKAQSYTGQPDGAKGLAVQQAMQYLYNNSTNPSAYPLGRANQGLTPNGGIVAGSNTVDWDQAYWDQAYWDQAYWDQAYWDQGTSFD